MLVESETTLAKIEQHGGKRFHGPHEIPGVGLHAYCYDPAGTLYGVLQPKTA